MRQFLRGLVSWRTWWRREVFVRKIEFKAKVAHAAVKLDVAREVRIGKRVTVYIEPGTQNELALGPGSRLDDDVCIDLKGGRFLGGPLTEIRRGGQISVNGELIMRYRNVISYFGMIHCAERIELDDYAGASEMVTIVDSRHFHSDAETYIYENMDSAPVKIGRNTWLANKSTVLMGVTIGQCVVIASHAVVNKDIPDYTLAGGIPAKPLRATVEPRMETAG